MESTSQHNEYLPKVTVVILNYNGWKDTIECLESVLKLDYLNYDIVILDNNSTNDSCAKILKWAKGEIPATSSNKSLEHLVFPLSPKPIPVVEILERNLGLTDEISRCDTQQIILIRLDHNGGFAAGNNVGLKYAFSKLKSDYAWILNNDTIVEKNALTALMTCLKSSPRIGILGSKLLYYNAPDTIQALAGKHNKWLCTTAHIGSNEPDNGQYDTIDATQFEYVVGASMFVSRSFVESVGLLYEHYFLYFEELDWCLRAKKKEWELAVCTASRVYHKEGASINQNETKSKLADYYSIRNRLVLTRRFFPFAVPLVYLSMVGVALNRLRKGQPERLKLILKAILD